METVNYHVPAINCKHCVATIKRELGSLDGVFSVEGDPDTKDIAVTFEPPADRRASRVCLSEIGYPAQQ